MENQLKQVELGDWDEIGYPEYIAVLPIQPQELSKREKIHFIEFKDEGLGRALSAMCKIDDVLYLLIAHPDGPPEAGYLSVQVRSTEPDSEHALQLLLDKINIERSNLIWEQEYLGKCRWVLSRLDDNGNEVEMFRFLNEDSAQFLKDKYTAKGHKQSYFVTKLD